MKIIVLKNKETDALNKEIEAKIAEQKTLGFNLVVTKKTKFVISKLNGELNCILRFEKEEEKLISS